MTQRTMTGGARARKRRSERRIAEWMEKGFTEGEARAMIRLIGREKNQLDNERQKANAEETQKLRKELGL